MSSTNDVIEHAAFIKIMGMGRDALLLILQEIEHSPRHYWFWALREITQENPVPPDHRGIIKMMAIDWLDWAKGKGLKWRGWKGGSPDYKVLTMKLPAKRMMRTTVSHGLLGIRLAGGGLIVSSRTIGPQEFLETKRSKLSSRLSNP